MSKTYWVPAWSAEPLGIDQSTGRAAFLESPRIGVEPFEINKVVLNIEGKRVIVDPWKLHSAMDVAIKIARGKQP